MASSVYRLKLRVTSKGNQKWSEKWGATLGPQDLFEVTDQLLKLSLFKKNKPSSLLRFRQEKGRIVFEIGERKDEPLYLNGQRAQSGAVKPGDRMTFMDVITIEVIEAGEKSQQAEMLPPLGEEDGPTRVATSNDRNQIRQANQAEDSTRAMSIPTPVEDGDGPTRLHQGPLPGSESPSASGDGPTITMSVLEPIVEEPVLNAAPLPKKAVSKQLDHEVRFDVVEDVVDDGFVKSPENREQQKSAPRLSAEKVVAFLKKLDPAPVFGVAGVLILVVVFYTIFSTGSKRSTEAAKTTETQAPEVVPEASAPVVSTEMPVAPSQNAPVPELAVTTKPVEGHSREQKIVAPLQVEVGIPIAELEQKAQAAGL